MQEGTFNIKLSFSLFMQTIISAQYPFIRPDQTLGHFRKFSTTFQGDLVKELEKDKSLVFSWCFSQPI